jgi:hypothetical protein
VGGNWTLSRARGNVEGENVGSGPITATVLAYPEYKDPRWNNPVGLLSIDERHKVRLWGTYELPVPDAVGRLGVSALHHYNSGRPYEAAGLADARPYVVNPGYRTPQGGASVAYFFSERGAFRTEGAHRTDVALNYSKRLPGVRRLEAFGQAQVLNLFHATALRAVNSTILTRSNDATLTPFNPFTETPVEGTHWRKGPLFGQATAAGSYQLPRTFLFSMGLRF